jgi:uncharacterized protein (TIGR03435 family)
MMKHVEFELNLGRKLLLGVVGLATVTVPAAFGLLRVTEVRAQSRPASLLDNIAATWQGTLHTDKDYRFVVKITKATDSTLRATFYNIDGPPGGVPAIATTLRGSVLKVELPFATFDGTVGAEGNSIAGMWRQGTNPVPLNFARATEQTEWAIPQAPPVAAPMAADADPSFDVATIKPSRPEERGPLYDFRGRRFVVNHASLGELLKFAYGLQDSQIAKAQDWIISESYDVSAVPDGEGEPSIKQWRSMVRKLIADRFQFKFHFEKKEQAVYVVTVAKSGPKLNKSESDAAAPGGMGFGPPGNFGATNQTMADIAEALGQGILNRPVEDQTGLPGRFNLRLKWRPDGPPAAMDDANALPDFFAAIQEQLGLKVTATRAPVDVMVIDKVERPSAN